MRTLALTELFFRHDLPSYVGFLPYHSMDPDGHVALLADNSEGRLDAMGVAWSLAPAESESRTDADVGGLAARIGRVLDSLPEGTIAQFLLHSSKDIRQTLDRWQDTSRATDPVLAELAAARRRAIESLRLATPTGAFEARRLELLFTVVRRSTWTGGNASPGEALRALACGQASSIEPRLREAYLAERRGMSDLASCVESLLAQAGMTARRLNEDGLAALLFRRLNPAMSRASGVPAADARELLRERVAQGSFDADLDEGLVRIDETFHRVVTVTKLPPATRAGMLMRSLEAAVAIDAAPESEWVLNIHVPDQHELRDRFGALRRLAQDQARDVHQSPTMAPHVEELVELERAFASGARVLSMRLHAIVRAGSAGEATERARVVQAALTTAGFRAYVEDVLAPSLFLSALPLAYRPESDAGLRRSRQALTGNVGHLAPIFGAFPGTPGASQILLNRRGEPILLTFFNGKEAPHAIVTGKSGAGKSVFANDLVLNALRSGGRLWVLDRGGSYRKLADMVAGTYVSYDARRPLRLNPCGAAAERQAFPEESIAFLRDWLTEMATHGKGDLSVRDQSLLSMAVRRAFAKVPDRELVLSDIHAALSDLSGEHPSARDLAVCLSDYVGDGPYARFFDGPNQIDFDAPFVALDLAEAAMEDAVTSVLVMGIMHQIAVAARRWLSEDKYLIIDEAWTLLKSSATARFIENVARTARKVRLSLVVLSQQLTDLDGPCGRAILGQTSYKVCLHQDAEAIRQAAPLLGLGPREVQLYATLRTVPGVYSELFVKTPSSSGVARLLMDPLSYWITTSDMQDRTLLEELVAKAQALGLSGRVALRAALVDAAERYPQGASARNARS